MLIKSDGGVSVGAGDVVVYGLDVQNVGDQDAAGVNLSETVPANSRFASGSSDPGWSCSSTSPESTCTLAIGSVTAGQSKRN